MRSTAVGSAAVSKPKPEATHPNARAFPEGLSGPALRALHNAGIRTLRALTRTSEAELLEMHGMGPKGVRMLKAALDSEGLGFRSR